MFVDLGSFNSEKAQYAQRVAELKGRVTDPAILARNIEEERLKFKGITRKYLASAINVLKEIFNVDYSLYKVGRDVDANFKTIETTVQKTQTEIANELNVYIRQANSMNLDAATSSKLIIAIDVIMSYVDDVAVEEDDNKAFYLNHTKVKASSLDLPVTKKENIAVQPAQEIQHNPYANKPVDLNPTPVVVPPAPSNEPLVNPFAGLYGENISTNMPNQTPVVSSVESAPVVSAADVFGAAAIATTTPAVTQATVQPTPTYISQPVVQSTVSQPVYSQPVQQAQSLPMYTQQPSGQPMPFVQPTLAPVTPNTDSNQSSVEDSMPQAKKTNTVFVEKNVVLFQIISALILPLLAFLAVFIYQKIMEFQMVRDFLGGMPTTLQTMSTYIILITIFVILGGPVLSLAKKRTRYLERFLVAPTLLSIPLMSLYIEYIPKFINSIDMALVFLATLLLYAPFVTLMFVSAFASLNAEKVENIKWNFLEKVGMLFVIYNFIIPTIYLILSTLNVTAFNEIYSIIYFVDNDSEMINTIFTAIYIALPFSIMLFRTLQNRKRAKRV